MPKKASDPYLWLKGLFSVIVGGALGGAAQALQTGSTDLKTLKTGAISGAIILTAGYFKSSPVTRKK